MEIFYYLKLSQESYEILSIPGDFSGKIDEREKAENINFCSPKRRKRKKNVINLYQKKIGFYINTHPETLGVRKTPWGNYGFGRPSRRNGAGTARSRNDHSRKGQSSWAG